MRLGSSRVAASDHRQHQADECQGQVGRDRPAQALAGESQGDREPPQPHGRRDTWPPPPGLSRCWWTGQALDHRPGGHAGQHAQEPDSDRGGEAAHRTVPCLRTVAELLGRPPSGDCPHLRLSLRARQRSPTPWSSPSSEGVMWTHRRRLGVIAQASWSPAGNGLAGRARSHPATSHATTGPRQGRCACLRDRLRRPLTRARAARAGVHAAPRGGRSQAGRPRAPPQAIPQECASSSSGAEEYRKEERGVTERQAHGSQPVGVRSGETPGPRERGLRRRARSRGRGGARRN